MVINGPNINMLGTREPEIYGSLTLNDLTEQLYNYAQELGIEIEAFQSNVEGEIVNTIQKAKCDCAGIVINPAAYTHTSVAIRDAIAAVALPCVEVHISNIHNREEFRRTSMTAPVCIGQISGFGANSYKLGLKGLLDYIKAT